MSTIARARTVIGSLYGLMRNALGLNVATPLESQELSCTVAPDRRLVVLGHEPIAGFSRDHGTVADEAAMLALHTLDSTTLLAEPRFVAPGDSCIRTDDPGWRWHCIAGHGQSLSDWERRPLAGALTAIEGEVAGAQPLDADLTAIAAQGISAWGLARMADSGATDAKNALAIEQADVAGLSSALAGKQATLANALVVADLSDVSGALAYKGAVVGGGGGSSGGASWCEGLSMWLTGGAARTSAGAVPVDGAATVAIVLDASGRGISPSQSSASLYPTYRASAINSLPAVEFSGSGSYTCLVIPSLARGDWAGLDGYEMLCVVRRLSSAVGCISVWGDAPHRIALAAPYSDGVAYGDWATITEGRATSNDARLTTSLDWHVLGFRRAAGAIVLSVNGVDVTTSADSKFRPIPASTSNTLFIGSIGAWSQRGNHMLAERLDWARSLTAEERAERVGYLRSKYAI